MRAFNLIDEKWIPCVMTSGEYMEMGIKDVLTKAHLVRELFDPSPLVTAALHRLLLAILHRIFGPPDFNTWKALWKQREWDGETLTEYLQKWHRRFYLFDEEHPF
ncbi:MAG: type I-E CRISPR-associated protein Cse1/CasA, partial [Acidobacteriota bacterium]